MVKQPWACEVEQKQIIQGNSASDVEPVDKVLLLD